MRTELGPGPDSEVAASFVATAADGGKTVDADAAALATQVIRGYPYLLQLVGSKAWALSEMRSGSTISLVDVSNARRPIIDQLGQQVHKIALRQVPDGERDYLEAMATVAESSGLPVTTEAVAQQIGKAQSQLTGVRHRLIERDLIVAPRRGQLEFRLPYLGEYLLA